MNAQWFQSALPRNTPDCACAFLCCICVWATTCMAVFICVPFFPLIVVVHFSSFSVDIVCRLVWCAKAHQCKYFVYLVPTHIHCVDNRKLFFFGSLHIALVLCIGFFLRSIDLEHKKWQWALFKNFKSIFFCMHGACCVLPYIFARLKLFAHLLRYRLPLLSLLVFPISRILQP